MSQEDAKAMVSEANVMANVIAKYSESFDKLCQERHEAGAKEYGVFTFLENDVVRMMAEELADTANYVRMQFIKVMMLNEAFLADPRLEKLSDGEEEITIGISAFKGVGETGWN